MQARPGPSRDAPLAGWDHLDAHLPHAPDPDGPRSQRTRPDSEQSLPWLGIAASKRNARLADQVPHQVILAGRSRGLRFVLDVPRIEDVLVPRY